MVVTQTSIILLRGGTLEAIYPWVGTYREVARKSSILLVYRFFEPSPFSVRAGAYAHRFSSRTLTKRPLNSLAGSISYNWSCELFTASRSGIWNTVETCTDEKGGSR